MVAPLAILAAGGVVGGLAGFGLTDITDFVTGNTGRNQGIVGQITGSALPIGILLLGVGVVLAQTEDLFE